MKGNPGVWGIDLGQCALKAIRLEEQEGEIVATAFDYIEHPKILSQPDADPDLLTREALDKFLERNSLRGDIVSVSIAGQSGLARFVKLPPVEEKKIADIVRFEAKQQIPFNLDEVIWDYQKIGAGTVMEGLAMDYEIGLFAMKRDLIGRSVQQFKDVGIEVDVIQMAPLSLCNFVSHELLEKGGIEQPDTGSKKCIVALDMGADSSNLIITNGERIIWQKPVNTGGNHFTRALTKDLKLTFAKAEHTKRNATKSPDLKKILSSLRPVLTDLVNEVQRSLGYFSNSHRDAQIEYMIGLGNAFRLPGLQRYLEEKLQLPVKKIQKIKHIKGDAVLNAPIFVENILSFPVAYGLALQGLKRSRLITNLLPNEIRVERLVRAKKPWAVAGAAALLLGLGGVALGIAFDYQAYAHPDVTAAIKQAQAVDSQARQAESTYQQTKSAALSEEDGVKSVVAGQDERFNWLQLTHFLGEALPRPDASNLSADARQEYFEKEPPASEERSTAMSGKRAYEEALRQQQGLGKQGDGSASDDPLGLGVDDLIQVNIEAVDCRYTDNLSTFWKNARLKVTNQGDIRPLDHWDNPPSGKGWVVEVRGYTFHHKKRRFVTETLLENLARIGIPDHGKKPATAPDGQPMPVDSVLDGQTPAATSGLPDKGPVKNRISHVTLYDARTDQSSDNTAFQLIGASVLDTLVTSAGGGATGQPGYPGAVSPEPMGQPATPGGEGQGATAGASRAGWQPIGQLGSVASGTGIGGNEGAGRPTGITGGSTAPGSAGTSGFRPSKHSRTEFIILFVWKEPTPSDSLRSTSQPGGDLGGFPAQPDPGMGMTDPTMMGP